MAFSFSGNSVTPTNYITVTGAAAIWAQEPFTVALWHRRTSDAVIERVCGNMDFSSEGWALGFTTFGSDGIEAFWDGTTRTIATQASTVAGGWTHWAFTVDTSHVLTYYKNGSTAGSNTYTAPASGNNNLIVGCTNTSSNVAVASPDIVFAEFAVWNAALTAAQISEMAGGAIPPMLSVAPVLYMPGDGHHGNWMGGLTLTQSGTVAYTADHPPVMRPSDQIIPFAVTTAGLLINCTGITAVDAYGVATLNPGAVTVSPSALSSAEAYGTATVNPGVVTVIPLSLSSGEAYGTAVLVFEQIISVLGIDSAEAFGATVIGDYLVLSTVTSTIVMPVATAVARGIVKIYT